MCEAHHTCPFKIKAEWMECSSELPWRTQRTKYEILKIRRLVSHADCPLSEQPNALLHGSFRSLLLSCPHRHCRNSNVWYFVDSTAIMRTSANNSIPFARKWIKIISDYAHFWWNITFVLNRWKTKNALSMRWTQSRTQELPWKLQRCLDKRNC